MAVLQTALTEADARLVDVFKAYGGRTVIVRKWEYIDATAADTLVAAAPATVVDPKADGQTYTGTYYVHTDQGEEQPDRSVTVIQILTSDGWFCYYDWTTKAGTAWTREWHKAATVLPVVPGTSDTYKTLFVIAGGNNNVSITQNADGTYDITATHQPSGGGGVFVGDEADWVTYKMESRQKPGSGNEEYTQHRSIAIHVYQKYYASKSDAAEFMKDEVATPIVSGWYGVAYEPRYGHGLWMAMVHIYTAVSGWIDDA